MLIPEVHGLMRQGKLHRFDAAWIGRLKPSSQMAAAVRCMQPNPTFRHDEQIRSPIATGSGRAGQDAR